MRRGQSIDAFRGVECINGREKRDGKCQKQMSGRTRISFIAKDNNRGEVEEKEEKKRRRN